MKVIVIGAGAAGLAATHALAKAGADVTTFEASAHAGGRARCYEKDGFIFDTGAQFMVSMCEAQIRLAKELGLGGEMIPFDLKVALWRNGKAYPLPSPSRPINVLRGIPELLRFRGLPFKVYPQMARVGNAMMKRFINVDLKGMNPTCLIDLGDTSVEQFVLQYGGPEALDWAMAPIAASLTLGEADQVGISHLICLIGFYKGLQLMERGIGSLPAALYKKHQDVIKLSTPVKKVVMENGAVKGVETAGGFMEADHVVCATTATMARKIMPDLPDTIRKPLETVKYSSTAHVMLAMEKRLLPEGLYAVSLPRTAGSFLPALNECSEKSPYLAPKGSGLSHCVSYGRYSEELIALPDAELVKRVTDEVRRFIPTATDKPLMAEVVRWKDAICLESPGQFPAMYVLKRNNIRDVKGLHLAGEYMYLISSVEGALRSGEGAAASILAES
ncbi:MAG TPA: NAD(P)/FAD-dependent oxidoreductase [Candidatus Anoxymicrobiaceae bacterium]|jgi:protoporphyrinogen oxidase